MLRWTSIAKIYTAAGQFTGNRELFHITGLHTQGVSRTIVASQRTKEGSLRNIFLNSDTRTIVRLRICAANGEAGREWEVLQRPLMRSCPDRRQSGSYSDFESEKTLGSQLNELVRQSSLGVRHRSVPSSQDFASSCQTAVRPPSTASFAP